MHPKPFLLPGIFALALLSAQSQAQQADEALTQKFKPRPAPKPSGLVLKEGDRLAICGDSITEQKMYSRIIEDYLTTCVPELKVTVRQYGWGGERAPGFLARMTNDCLRFKPTVATTCYGMNDHEYRAYEERIGETYRLNSTAIVEAFKANGARVIQGSPGCVGTKVPWAKSVSEEMNLNLCQLRNIGIEIAQKENAGFADVFWPMLTAGAAAQQKYGTNYSIAGADGVHPGWAGQTVMAYAFLKALGLDGNLGTLTMDFKARKLTGADGHQVVSEKDGEFEIKSSRYPFCLCVPKAQAAASFPVCGSDDESKDSTIRSATTLVPFQQELNRLMLIVQNGTARNYSVRWGDQSKRFTAEQLAAGVNLAAEFPSNPFCEPFGKVDAAVAAKQAYETKQIKQTFRSAEAKADMEAVAAQTEKERGALAEAIKAAFAPVSHTLKIVGE